MIHIHEVCKLDWFGFRGSSLKVLGNMSSPLEGEWAILGGTGEFAYAQGVVLFKIQKFYELQVRVLCLNFSSSLSLVYTIFFLVPVHASTI